MAVAEEHSFTRAAERLHTVQPSLSQQIRTLENDIIGTALFHRNKQGVELTEAGRAFLPEARSLLDAAERAIHVARQAGRGESGHLIVGIIPGAEGDILPRVLPALHADHPRIGICLKGLKTPEQLLALQNKSIDVGFLRGPIQGPDLCWEPIFRHVIVAVLPAHHDLARYKRIPLSLLAKLPLVRVPELTAPAIHDIVKLIAEQQQVCFSPGPETDGVLETLDMVGSGLGFSLLPSYVRRIKPTTVEIRPLDMEPQPAIDLYVACRRHDPNPSLVPLLSLLHKKIRSTPRCCHPGDSQQLSRRAKVRALRDSE